MTKEPEQVLPEQRIASSLRIEERPMERPFDLEQHAPGNKGRKRKDDHGRGHQDIPAVGRYQVDAHPGRPALQGSDDQLDGRCNGCNLDE